jgi:pSer/pThr/pTyr-binding forkhead associated (FHA) protein
VERQESVYTGVDDYVRFERNTGMNVNLVLFKKNGSTKAFPLPQTVTVIGRQQHCDLCIPLMVVSRKHCEISQDGGVLRVRDLGSRNGVLVNGKKVAESVLKAGDKLQVGPVSLAVQIDGQPAQFAASDSDIRRTPANLDDTAVQDEENALIGGGETETDDGEDDVEFFDNLLDGLEKGDA